MDNMGSKNGQIFFYKNDFDDSEEYCKDMQCELLLNTWNGCFLSVNNEEIETISFSIFCSKLRELTKDIKIENEGSLDELLICSKKGALKLKNQKKKIFIFLRFQQMIEYDEKNYLIYLKNPDMKTVVSFICSKELWSKSLNVNKVKEPPFMLSGEIDISNNIMIFKRLWVAPISDMGIPVYNNRERELFNKLHEENNMFELK